jgi:hypothetical protein
VTCSERDRLKNLLSGSLYTFYQAIYEASNIPENLSTEARTRLTHLGQQQDAAHEELRGLQLSLDLHRRLHGC